MALTYSACNHPVTNPFMFRRCTWCDAGAYHAVERIREVGDVVEYHAACPNCGVWDIHHVRDGIVVALVRDLG